MANPARGEIEVEVGGRSRILRYDWGSIASLWEEVGAKDYLDLFNGVALNHRTLLAALYHGLRGGGDASVTRKEVGTWTGDLAAVRQAVSEALYRSLGLKSGEEDTGPAGEGKAPEKSPEAPTAGA